MSTRTLRLTSPHMHGPDVKLAQHDINAELERWNVPHAVTVDGSYGPDTRDAAKSVLYGLGVLDAMEHGLTPALRLKIRNRKLTAVEQKRFDERAGWRKRLAARYGGGAVSDALDWARAQIGVTERPAGSNTGPKINDWERACGVHAAPWCGCFANGVLVQAGLPNEEWLRYCPSIEAVAKAGDGGWKWIPADGTVQPLDLALYGVSEAEHVGVVETVADGRDTATIEGNTTTGPGGPQSNGGIVARRHRHTDGSLAGFPIRGYARPPV